MNDMTPIKAAAQLDLFYGSLDAVVASKARAAAERIRGRMELAAESIIEVGRELIEQKAALGHGNFLPWIDAEFGMSEDTAQRYARVATELGDKYRTVRNLAPTALYALAAPATPVEIREQVEELVADGQKFTARDIADLKRSYAEAKGKLDASDADRLRILEDERAKVAKELDAAKKADAKKTKATLKSKDEKIRTLTARLKEIEDDPILKEMRQAVKDAADGKVKQQASRSNPVYEKPSKENQQMMKVLGGCRLVLDYSRKIKPEVVLAGFFDDGHKADGIKTFSECRDFLNSILEAANAQ